RLSKRLGASAALQHHFLRGAMAVWLGHLADAESHLTKALRSSVSLEEADRPYGANPLVAARSFEGLRRWATGDAAAARVIQKEAVALAEQQGRPFTVAQALMFSSFVFLFEGDWAEAGRCADRALALSEEYGFLRWRGRAQVILGRKLVEEGDSARGL